MKTIQQQLKEAYANLHDLMHNLHENISQDGHLLNQLAANQIGGVPATEFIEQHDLDVQAIKRAIDGKAFNAYELRDIIKGTANASVIKRFMVKYKNK